jgi:OmpR-family two-component system manganese-sensing response regulator
VSKILLVDDDAQLTDTLYAFLKGAGYVVDVSPTGEDALQLLSASEYDIIILDWTLPGISGYDVCSSYRKIGGQAPIIYLTGKSDVSFLESALEAGGDDYITKPFDMRELSARMKAILKRRMLPYVDKLSISGLTLDPSRQSLIPHNDSFPVVKLRGKESLLLEYLMRHPNQLFSAQDLLCACWPADSEAGTDTVRTWIKLLRQRLAEIGRPDLVKTVIGSGYILQIDSENPLV